MKLGLIDRAIWDTIPEIEISPKQVLDEINSICEKEKLGRYYFSLANVTANMRYHQKRLKIIRVDTGKYKKQLCG